jgi:hypothetical protein
MMEEAWSNGLLFPMRRDGINFFPVGDLDHVPRPRPTDKRYQ